MANPYNKSLTMKRDKLKEVDPCKHCGFVFSEDRALVDHMINIALPPFEEPQPRRLSTKLAASAVDAMIDRTNHESKRAKRDVLAAMFVLKGYEGRGGKI